MDEKLGRQEILGLSSWVPELFEAQEYSAPGKNTVVRVSGACR